MANALIVGRSGSYVGQDLLGEAIPSAPTDALETRVLLLGLDEHEEDVRGYAVLGNIILDGPLAVVVLLLEEWAPDFEETRDDFIYQQLLEAAAAAGDDSETRVLLEDAQVIEELGEEAGDITGFTIDEIFDYSQVLFDEQEEPAEEDYTLYPQLISDAEVAPDDSETRVLLDEFVESIELVEYELYQQLIDDAQAAADDSETRVYFEDLREDESDVRGTATLGNIILDAAPVVDEIETRPWVEDAQFEEDFGEELGDVIGFTIDEIFYIVQELLEDTQAGVEWLEEPVYSVVEEAAPIVDSPETRVFLEAPEDELESWSTELYQQLIEETVAVDAPETRVLLEADVFHDDLAEVFETVATRDVEEIFFYVQELFEDIQDEVSQVEDVIHQLVEPPLDVPETRVFIEDVETIEDMLAYEAFFDQIIEAAPVIPGLGRLYMDIETGKLFLSAQGIITGSPVRLVPL